MKIEVSINTFVLRWKWPIGHHYEGRFIPASAYKGKTKIDWQCSDHLILKTANLPVQTCLLQPKHDSRLG